MPTDDDVAYASPSTVYRIFKRHDLLAIQERKSSRKGRVSSSLPGRISTGTWILRTLGSGRSRLPRGGARRLVPDGPGLGSAGEDGRTRCRLLFQCLGTWVLTREYQALC